MRGSNFFRIPPINLSLFKIIIFIFDNTLYLDHHGLIIELAYVCGNLNPLGELYNDKSFLGDWPYWSPELLGILLWLFSYPFVEAIPLSKIILDRTGVQRTDWVIKWGAGWVLRWLNYLEDKWICCGQGSWIVVLQSHFQSI